MKKITSANPQLHDLVAALKKCSTENKAPIWKRIAKELSKPVRLRRAVNIQHIEDTAENGDTVIVPGKVLATGELKKKVKVAAWQFSEQAQEKIKDTLTIQALMKENPKGANIKIIG